MAYEPEKVARVILGMKPWWERQLLPAKHSRKHVQSGWNAGVIASSELVRRLTGNEELAGAVHGLLASKLPRDEP